MILRKIQSTGSCDQLTHGWIWIPWTQRLTQCYQGVSRSLASALTLSGSAPYKAVAFSPVQTETLRVAKEQAHHWFQASSFQPNTVERASVSQHPLLKFLGFIPRS